MKKLYILVLLLLSFFSIFLFKSEVKAVEIYQSRYDVEIDIEEDSTFTVEETLTNVVNGNFHGLRADIPLTNPNCEVNPGRTCGGFELLFPLGIYDENGNKPDIGTIRTYEYTPENSSTTYFRFEWEIYPQGQIVNNEEYTWTIKYKVLGGIRWLANAREQEKAYFYWNVLGRDLGQRIDKSMITINFPSSVDVKRENLEIYSVFKDLTETKIIGDKVVMNLANLNGLGDFTVSYEFEEDELTRPGVLEYEITSPQIGNEVFWKGYRISTDAQDAFYYFPAGTHKLVFQRDGYISETEEIEVSSNETTSLEIELEPESWMKALLSLNSLATLGGILLIPLLAFIVFSRFSKKGRDEKEISTIIPLYSPPENVPPYLLGSLKDEVVDRTDITGTIIDLAYRGHIKIKEIQKGKNYELTKLNERQEDRGLNNIEQELIDALFGNSTAVQTKNLNINFVNKLKEIENKIYDELVERQYFKESPKSVRDNHRFLGYFFFIGGIVSSFCLSLLITLFLGEISVFTVGIAVIVLGIVFLILARHMPAKTELGSKILNQVRGFKMYLQTAERFRLQNLGPEEFERYLSYAVVFGIEEQWAEKFKGIYNKAPEWFEGDGRMLDAAYIGHMARSFSNSTTDQIRSITNAASKGSGWSSGGSFGGFSGGGGGGGSRGGW